MWTNALGILCGVKKEEESFSVMNFSAIYRSSRSRNIVFWSKQNPHFFEEVEHPPPHGLVWGVMNSEYLFWSGFFDGPVNHLNY